MLQKKMNDGGLMNESSPMKIHRAAALFAQQKPF